MITSLWNAPKTLLGAIVETETAGSDFFLTGGVFTYGAEKS